MERQLLVLSTGQHVGKTTVSLGLLQYLKQKFENTNKKIAYCKPVGQQHIPVGDNLRVDKDAYLFKEHFKLVHEYQHMSPVIFPNGFTRDYIDGKVTSEQLYQSIQRAHDTLYNQSDYLVCEGTGHTGVGSICDLNNAQVAARLGMSAVCVTLGGLGSSFDQFAMNRELLVKHGARLKGVILNKVNADKLPMIKDYFSRALQRWDIPLLGCIPELPELSRPTMADYCKLFRSTLISGEKAWLRHFSSIRLALAPVDEKNIFKAIPKQLVITHTGRMDVIDAILGNQTASIPHGKDLQSGLIMTGWNPPSARLKQKLDLANIPCIYVSPDKADSYTLTTRLATFTAKIRLEDTDRLDLAAKHVLQSCDFSRICM
uniref:Uncharacterized protein AlNc14C72G4945 n=1 Tax=Albugo laibachii Nc14 TaxID=890382 RepID=F0WE89_9STRA|nr:conserved hypothetical protein [Albugo laibachii Nc14]|eukprot:CCA19519.1 conserved hypothetical protein [Albugo laibachii Nc14]